jgi:hypothetical protein
VSQNTFQNSDILLLANEELSLNLVGEIFKTKEDFFLTWKQVSLRANVSRYVLPKRAIANTLKDVFYIDAGGSYHHLERVEVDRVREYQGGTGTPQKYFFAGDEIVLYPTPSQSQGYLKFYFHAKPNKLILTESCAKITAVSSNSTHTTFTVDTDLTASLSVGSKVDFLSNTSPFLLWNEEVAITAITTTTIEVAIGDVQDEGGTVEPQINDYICPTGYSNIPMIPEEAHVWLSQLVVCRLLAALHHAEKLAVAQNDLKMMMSNFTNMIKNRVELSPLRPRNRNGLLAAFRGG